jgi:cytochrome P450
VFTRIPDAITSVRDLNWGSLKAAATFVQGLPAYFSFPADCSKEDLQRLRNEEEQFILTELYARARDNGSNITRLKMPFSPFVASWSLDYLPSNIYVITGPEENARQVANYGEANKDPKARIHFRFFKKMMGRPNFTHSLLDSDETRSERGMLKGHLVQSKDFECGRKIALKRTRNLFKNWDPAISFLDQMTYLGSNIMGEAVLGIPELDLKYSRKLRDIGKSLSEFYKHPSSVKPVTKFIADLNKTIVTEQGSAILAADKFAKKDFDQHADPEKNMTAELLKRKPASWYAAESALSAVLSMGIAQLSSHPELKQQLKAELLAFKKSHGLENNDSVTVDDLRNSLPLLDAFYLETLRYSSTLSTVARKTSIPTSLTIRDDEGVAQEHEIPAESILLFPVRPRHFNEKFWDESQKFNPDRFNLSLAKTEEQRASILRNRKELLPFSVGSRSCPSQYGFSEVVFKTVILESLEYEIKLDSEIESIPVWVPMPHLEKNYLATVTPEIPEVSERSVLRG